MPDDRWRLHHATCVLLGPRAVLIRGRPGAGKSRLALRLIEAGAAPAAGVRLAADVRLVADDQVWLRSASGRLVARAPKTIRGLLEVRGLGLVHVPFEPLAVVGLVADLVPPGAAERLPDAPLAEIEGVRLPRLQLEAADEAAACLVCLCLRGAPPTAGRGLASDRDGHEDARLARGALRKVS